MDYLTIGILVVTVILLVIYFHATRMLKLPLDEKEMRKWRFIRITSTVCTLAIVAYLLSQ